MHHAYADTKEDPHSPKYDNNPFAMMWKTKNIYHQIFIFKIIDTPINNERFICLNHNSKA